MGNGKLRKRASMELTRHHRRCKSNQGGNERENISLVPDCLHRSWHEIFSNHKPLTIAHIINDKWIPRDKRFICVDACRHHEIIMLLQERKLI